MNKKINNKTQRRAGIRPAKEAQCVVNYALYCLKSETNEATLRRKLKKKTDSIEWIDAAIDRVKGWGYLDDARFAEIYTRNAISIKGWGVMRIQQELRQKGVADDVIRRAIAEVDDGESDERAKVALGRKFKSLIKDARERAKAERFLVARGYTFECASKAVVEHNNELDIESEHAD